MNEWQQALRNMHHALIQPLAWKGLKEKGITAGVLRLDAIHPVVSGNKLFKLKPYLDQAVQQHYPGIITFGGAWSNHIVAAAYAAKQYGLLSTGIIRGEAPAALSQTLITAEGYGMQLQFVSRSYYSNKTTPEFTAALTEKFPDAFLIPEGGFGEPGMEGSRNICNAAATTGYTHILCAIGTGTMFTGLVNGSLPGQHIIGIPVLKGMQDLLQQLSPFFEQPRKAARCAIMAGYHWGGYARKTPALLRFMNDWYTATGIPTDFVYTAKLMFAFTDLLLKGSFPPDSRVLLVHSGGLQGNASLPRGTLLY